MTRRVVLRRQLNTFDVTSLVVGSIIGADIYVAATLGARLVGPASLLVWLLAGVMATMIALSFSHCAAILPKVGGPYSYVKEVAGPFCGFIVGWALLLAEWLSLAVFPVAFTQYLFSFIPNPGQYFEILSKGVFILIILITNVFGTKAAGRFNDMLTIGKLTPLLLLVCGGLWFITANPATTLSNFQPFIKGDAGSFGQALVLIFWAYAGFELSTLPADEIQRPKRTIPKAIVAGMLIVTAFYLVTNFVIVSTVDQATLIASSTPLMVAAARAFSLSLTLSQIGGLVVGVGALISIMGADESGTIGTSRLAFAMSIDGLLPEVFSRLHRRFRTPYVGLILICSTAFIASTLGTLPSLINAAVFLLALAYLSTAVSTILLEKKYPNASKDLKWRELIPVMAAAFSVVLATQVDVKQILISLLLVVSGIPIYTFFSPKKELRQLKEIFLSRDAILWRAFAQGERFLAHPVRHIEWLVHKTRRIERAWQIEEDS